MPLTGYTPRELPEYTEEEVEGLRDFAQGELNKVVKSRLGRKLDIEGVDIEFYPWIYGAEVDISSDIPVIKIGLGTPKSEIRRMIKHEVLHLQARQWDYLHRLERVGGTPELEEWVIEELKATSLEKGGDSKISSQNLVILTRFMVQEFDISLDEAWEEVKHAAAYYFKISPEVRERAKFRLGLGE